VCFDDCVWNDVCESLSLWNDETDEDENIVPSFVHLFSFQFSGDKERVFKRKFSLGQPKLHFFLFSQIERKKK
jgi:hypothetical protein